MKIVTWNCNGALRKKLSEVDDLDADVLVVQECEDPQLYNGNYFDWAGDYLWIGTTKNKGIGVFPKKGNRVNKLSWHGSFAINGLVPVHNSTAWTTSDLRLFLPFSLDERVTVLAVWTKGSDNESFRYVGQLWKYLQIHMKDLSGPSTIIIGDLNSNAVWDRKDRWWSHSGVVAELANAGIRSLYHHAMQEEQGAESIPTFYLQRNLSKPYHIDYVFVSSDLISTSSLEIGKSSDWLPLSDHVPLVAIVP